MQILIKSCRLVGEKGFDDGECDILIKDGVIAEIGYSLICNADIVVDGAGLTAMPGFVDMHVHLREPGFEGKETVKTGTQAAAKGGYTTLCAMPNTMPVMDSLQALSQLMGIIERDAEVKVLPICSITKGEMGLELTDLLELKKAGAIAFSDDGRPVVSSELLKKALIQSKEYGILLIEHCEDLSLAEGGTINEGSKSKELGIKGIPALAEEIPLMRDIMVAEAVGASIHIAHVSTAGAVKIIREAKARGVRITCEAAPHHLALTEDIIEAGFMDCKVNPPLRTEADREAIVMGLVDGTIDAIATDHAPHREEDKIGDFYQAAFGISGIETAFSVCYTELVKKGFMKLEELVDKLSTAPARILGLKNNALAVGNAADIVLADLDKKVVINKQELVSKGKNTPFHGRCYQGEVCCTLVGGEIKYRRHI